MHSKPLGIEQQCGTKRRHATPAQATEQKKSLGYTGLETYRCVFCSGYHVGNSSPRNRDRSYQRQRGRLWRGWATAAGE